LNNSSSKDSESKSWLKKRTQKRKDKEGLKRNDPQQLNVKLHIFEDQVENVKKNIPVALGSLEGKLSSIKGSLNDLRNSEKRSDSKSKNEELKDLSREIDGLDSDLDKILSTYQILINSELSSWIAKLKDSGLKVKSPVNVEFPKGSTIDERIEAVKQTLEAGRALAKEVLEIAEPVYAIIRPLYDPSLPEKSRAVEFTLKMLEQKDSPWIAIEALYTALNNWKRQYGAEIVASMTYLKGSLNPIADLKNKGEVLQPIFGENLSRVLDYAKKAESMKLIEEKKFEKEQLNILDVVALKDDIQSFLEMARDVISTLYAELVSEGESIERLMPTKDYLWEKNDSLRERLKTATETLLNPSLYKINQLMENLPIYMSYVDEAVPTITVYIEQKEFLLNYPAAEAAIEERLKQEKQVSPQELPFQPKFAGEYLRLYYSQRFSEFAFDRENQLLTRKT